MKTKKIICVLGVPGSGKTTFGNMLKRDLDTLFLEEQFDSISSISKERGSNSSNFEKCIGFLNMRHRQMKEAASSGARLTFVDTCFEMTEVYSKYLLNSEELFEFKITFDIINSFVAKPDLYLFLKGDIDVLLERATKRNIEISVDIENTYLTKEVLEKSQNEIKYFLKGKSFIELDVTSEDIRQKVNIEKILSDINKRLL